MHMGRRQVVLFVSERSLLPVVVEASPGGTLGERHRVATGELLRRLGAPPGAIELELAAMADVRLGRTANRRVVGSMNDFAFMLEAYLRGGDELMGASLRLAGAPCSPIGMRSPDEVTVELLGGGPGRERPEDS